MKVDNVVDMLVNIIAVFFILAGIASTLISAANDVNTSGLPLANLFASDGVGLTLMMIGIFIGIIKLAKRT